MNKSLPLFSNKAKVPNNDRTPERTLSINYFRQKRQAVWPMRQEPYKSASLLHFSVDHKKKLRWLAHFYSFFWWETLEDERHCKRFMRDGLRYRDEVFCIAAKVIHKINLDAAKFKATDKGTKNGG